jgi:hypothetical protein
MKGVIKIWCVESKQEVFSFALPIDESAAAAAAEEEEEEEDLMVKFTVIVGTLWQTVVEK